MLSSFYHISNMFLFYHFFLDSKTVYMGKIKKPSHKLEGATEQSNQMGTTKPDAPFLVAPLAVLLYGQTILTEPEGSGMNKL